MKTPLPFLMLSLLSGAILAPCPLLAEIVPDQTLPINSQVESGCTQCVITGGTVRGGNLFHSFDRFSVPTGGSASFSSVPEVQNILTRITGRESSKINGIVQSSSPANIIIFNPNGISFGANARLDVGGSFLATTASDVLFKDGSYGASNPETPLLKNVGEPIGLAFRSQPSEIKVQGSGHGLNGRGGVLPVGFGATPDGLKLRDGNSFALIGGAVSLDGGILNAPSGEIELGAVRGGIVDLISTSKGLGFGYSQVSSFGNISLSGRSLINASGFSGGAIHVQGDQIDSTGGSVGLIQNRGRLPSGSISINSGLLRISGTDPIAKIPGGFFTESIGQGRSGDISISTNSIQLISGGILSAKTFGPSAGGRIDLSAVKSIEVLGGSQLDPRLSSSILSGTFGDGSAGDINLSTASYRAVDGGTILSLSQGRGSAGAIKINTGTIELAGRRPATPLGSVIISAATREGAAGSIEINTSRLSLLYGRISSVTAGAGNAGSLTIQASDSIDLKSAVIDASADIADPFVQQAFRIGNVVLGKGGRLEISTGRLRINEGGAITVKNEGAEEAGDLKINARTILLNGGGLSAIARKGDGGNIKVDSQFFGILGKSQVIADAAGRGGNIRISTAGLLVSPFSLFSARSTSGDPSRKGDIDIKQSVNPSNDRRSRNPRPQILKTGLACSHSEEPASRFTMPGKGGVPANHADLQEAWSDPATNSNVDAAPPSDRFVQANRVIRRNGALYLVSDPSYLSGQGGSDTGCGGEKVLGSRDRKRD